MLLKPQMTNTRLFIYVICCIWYPPPKKARGINSKDDRGTIYLYRVSKGNLKMMITPEFFGTWKEQPPGNRKTIFPATFKGDMLVAWSVLVSWIEFHMAMPAWFVKHKWHRSGTMDESRIKLWLHSRFLYLWCANIENSWVAHSETSLSKIARLKYTQYQKWTKWWS